MLVRGLAPPVNDVEIDALADQITAGELLVAIERRHLGWDHRQRQGEPVFAAA
jgi:hypothetical protein